jgi:type I restriction enzyme S subunit
MLLSNLDVLATAPGGVARLRELILTLAVQGKLVPQDPADEPASGLLKMIRAEKDRSRARSGGTSRWRVFRRRNGRLPAGWEWVRFGDVALISSGVTLGRKTATVFLTSAAGVNLTSMKEVVIDRELDRTQRLV